MNVIALFLGSQIGPLVLAGIIPSHRLNEHLMRAFAIGTLLGAVIFDLLPESMAHIAEGAAAGTLVMSALLAMAAFAALEVWLHWRHEAQETEHSHAATTWLVALGDGVHNAMDGVALGLVALANPSALFGTALAIAAHELPQEAGDFCALRSTGAAEKKTWTLQIASSLTAVVAMLLTTYVLREQIEPVLPYLLGASCGFFLYLAAHLAWQSRNSGSTLSKVAVGLAGFGLLFLVTALVPEAAH